MFVARDTQAVPVLVNVSPSCEPLESKHIHLYILYLGQKIYVCFRFVSDLL